MLNVRVLQCCGVTEINNLSGFPKAEVALKEFIRNPGNFDKAFVLFSSTGPYGRAFKDLIQSKGFGSVVEVGPKRTPNTGNQLTLWVWSPDQAAIRASKSKKVAAPRG